MEPEIQHRIATMLNAIDALDWSTVRVAFAPLVPFCMCGLSRAVLAGYTG